MICQCGADVRPLGMASHLRGGHHRCELTRVRAIADGFTVYLPGSTAHTVDALERREIPVRGVGYWIPGSQGTRGYEATRAYVRPEDVARILASDLGKRKLAKEGTWQTNGWRALAERYAPETLPLSYWASRPAAERPLHITVLVDAALERGEI